MQIDLIRSVLDSRFDWNLKDRVEERVEFDDVPCMTGDVDESMLHIAGESFIAPWKGWTVNPQAQRRQCHFGFVRKDASHSAGIPGALETHVAALSKPTDRLPGRGEPSPRGFQGLDEPDVKVAPEPLWCMTSVMPENR